MKDMTEGKPVRLILNFAFPLLLGNLFQQTYNMADAAIVGQFLGADALAGVGASSSIQFLVLGFCLGTCTGFCIPVAQRFGAKDYGAMRKYIYNSILLTGSFGLLLTVMLAIFCPGILHLLSTPDNIFRDAYYYLLIIFLGIPCALLYNLTAGILRAVGDSRTPFIFLVVSTILNIFLDLFCILVLQWGVAGAAIATIASQGVSGILCLIYVIRRFDFLHLSEKDRVFSVQFMKNLVLMGFPTGLQFSITAIGSMVLQSANNSLGSIYISGFTAAMKIKQLMMSPFDAISTGVATFCSQNLGAGKGERIKTGIRRGVLIAASYGAAAGILLILFGRGMSLIFLKSDQTAILDAAGRYLSAIGIFFWELGFLNVLRMTIQGLGYSGAAVFSGVAEMFARIFVSVIFVPIAGYTAVTLADPAAWTAACLYVIPLCVICVKKALPSNPSPLRRQ